MRDERRFGLVTDRNVSPSQHDRIRPVASRRDPHRRDRERRPPRRCRRPRRPDPRCRRPLDGRGGRGRDRARCHRPRRRAGLHRSARPLRRLALPRRGAGQPPAPGLHHPAVGELRRHAGPDHRHRPRDRRRCCSARTGSSPAGGRSGSTSIASREQPLGPNVAFLVGHGTIRASVLGAEARRARPTRSSRRWSARSRRRSTPARSASPSG